MQINIKEIAALRKSSALWFYCENTVGTYRALLARIQAAGLDTFEAPAARS
jgi:hypothetical protein